MNSHLHSLIIFSSVCLSLAQAGCSFFGTGTGNPFTQNNGSSSVFAAGLVANEACMTTVRCHAQAGFEDCRKAVWKLTTLTEKLGLPSLPVRTVVEIEDLERTGELVANSTALQRCLVAVRSHGCSTPEAVAAYAPLSTNPYDGVANLLGPGCVDVFR